LSEKFDRKTLEAQLQELRDQIADIVKRLETAVGKEAEALRPKLKALQEKLHDLKQTSGEAWGDLKPGLQKAWDELHKSLSQAASRFKTPKQ
jgi:predicted  nucleic acid-binding Zn-ribbon protein